MKNVIDGLLHEKQGFAGVFSPEETAMMKRVLEQLCEDNAIADHEKDKRESLALVILRACKDNTLEKDLRRLGQYAAKNY